MEINIEIPTEDLSPQVRIDLLAQIAEGMTKEARETPREAILCLMTAAALISLRNGGSSLDMAEIIPTALDIAAKMNV